MASKWGLKYFPHFSGPAQPRPRCPTIVEADRVVIARGADSPGNPTNGRKMRPTIPVEGLNPGFGYRCFGFIEYRITGFPGSDLMDGDISGSGFPRTEISSFGIRLTWLSCSTPGYRVADFWILGYMVPFFGLSLSEFGFLGFDSD